ncbi:MAG: type II toxin-antitoxin system PrlF family antitoxin [Deltaproteobacteria bacterium]|nr:type II toxin-antitoxin system PrlF family antitoxin [Deltaproteobacteria bacterium]
MPEQTEESKLTDRYQTTVPELVRKTLKLERRDRIRYSVQSNGTVVMSRAPEREEDPVLGKFLAFLANDMAAHPDRIQSVGAEFAERLRSLTRGVEVDLDAPLSEDDE